MNLEKIKEIRELCKNLDRNKIVDVYQNICNKNFIKLDQNIKNNDGDYIYITYDIDVNNEYNDLVHYLKSNQKQPDLYTFDEIIRTITNASVMYSHDDNYIDWLKEFIKSNIVPYKKKS